VNERQLAWVQQNRVPGGRAERVGRTANRVLDGMCTSTVGHLTQLQRVIGAGADEEFRNHCTLGSLRRNVLTVLVDQESLVSAMRLEWFSALGELIATQCRGFYVGDIRFQLGRSELAFNCPEPNGRRHEGQHWA